MVAGSSVIRQSKTTNRIGQYFGPSTWSRHRLGLSFVTLRREEIDWPGLRAAAIAIGIRPAARQAARDLQPDEQKQFVRSLPRTVREQIADSLFVRSFS